MTKIRFSDPTLKFSDRHQRAIAVALARVDFEIDPQIFDDFMYRVIHSIADVMHTDPEALESRVDAFRMTG